MPRRRVGWTFVALVAGLVSCGPVRFEVDGARAHARVVHQVEMGPRIPGTPGHRAFETWLNGELTRLGGRLEAQTFRDTLHAGTYDFTNWIAHFGPATGRRVVLSAHYDSRPWSDQDPDSSHRNDPVPGANDGGSGVAVLLEVAELMAKHAPPVGVDLVFFDGEDLGRPTYPDEFCRGSRGYAARLGTDRPVAAFNFDMVGDRELAIHPEPTSQERAASVAALVLDAAHATRASHFFTTPGLSIYDDHIPLLDAGLPAVDIIDFDYPAWHTHRDLPDQVSPESLAEVAGVAAWLVYRSPLARSQ